MKILLVLVVLVLDRYDAADPDSQGNFYSGHKNTCECKRKNICIKLSSVATNEKNNYFLCQLLFVELIPNLVNANMYF